MGIKQTMRSKRRSAKKSSRKRRSFRGNKSRIGRAVRSIGETLGIVSVTKDEYHNYLDETNRKSWKQFELELKDYGTLLKRLKKFDDAVKKCLEHFKRRPKGPTEKADTEKVKNLLFKYEKVIFKNDEAATTSGKLYRIYMVGKRRTTKPTKIPYISYSHEGYQFQAYPGFTSTIKAKTILWHGVSQPHHWPFHLLEALEWIRSNDENENIQQLIQQVEEKIDNMQKFFPRITVELKGGGLEDMTFTEYKTILRDPDVDDELFPPAFLGVLGENEKELAGKGLLELVIYDPNDDRCKQWPLETPFPSEIAS